KTGVLKHNLTGHEDLVNTPVFLDGGKKLATCSHDRTVRLWDVKSGTLERTITTNHTERIYGLAATPDEKFFATASWDMTARVLDAASGEEKLSLRPRRYQAETNFPLWSVACSPDGKKLAVCGEEKAIKLLDPASGQLL